MIIVDIYVPSMDKTYDFKLDENEPIQILLDEIVEMICQKEQSEFSGSMQDLILCAKESMRIFDENMSLKMAGITTGETLILV